jgi:AraC-like DNA-binding protein
MIRIVITAIRSRLFFRKTLILAFLISCLPTTIIGTGSYYIGVSHMENEMKKNHDLQLQQMAERLNEQLFQLQVMANQWSNTSEFGEQLKMIDFADRFQFTHDLYKALVVMGDYNPIIKNVKLYLSGPQVWLSNSAGLIRLQNSEDIERYELIMRDTRSSYWQVVTDSSLAQDNTTVQMIQKLDAAQGAIIVELNKAEITKYLQQLTPGHLGLTLLLTENGLLLGSSQAKISLDYQELYQSLSLKASHQSGKSEDIVYEIAGSPHMVSFQKLDHTGWYYVSAVPLLQSIEPLRTVSGWLLGLNIAVLGIAVILSVMASARLYAPFQKMLQKLDINPVNNGNELEWIQQEWKQMIDRQSSFETATAAQRPILKQGFLIQLIQGYFYAYSGEQLKNRMEHLGWEVGECQFGLIYIQISTYIRERSTSQQDQQLLTFAAANIVEELIISSGIPHLGVINLQNMYVCLIYTQRLDQPKAAAHPHISALLQTIRGTLESVLKLDSVIGVSRLTTEPEKLPDLLEEVRMLFRMRDVNSKEGIYYYTDWIHEYHQTSYYPFSLERSIITAIQKQSVEQVAEYISLFVSELRAGAEKEINVQHGILMLFIRIQHASLKQGISLPVEWIEPAFTESIYQLREVQAITNWLLDKVALPLIMECKINQQVKDSRLTSLMEQVKHFILDNYRSNISLEVCADQFGFTPSMFSKVFKQCMGINFIDYVTQLRMNEAIRLLKDTDMKINDIAQELGYQPTYFNRIFKKEFGITAGEYRRG